MPKMLPWKDVHVQPPVQEWTVLRRYMPGTLAGVCKACACALTFHSNLYDLGSIMRVCKHVHDGSAAAWLLEDTSTSMMLTPCFLNPRSRLLAGAY
jgi:hypothetical protein